MIFANIIKILIIEALTTDGLNLVMNIKSIRKQTGSHPVHVIDQNSYSVYIDIPDYMMHKVKNGQMGIAHLSDYIRVSLLEKYGGLWLDSTIFCASSLPESYFELPFFTCKSNPTSCGYLSQMRWTTFVLGGWRGNVFYRFIKEAFEEYWSQEQGLPGCFYAS